MQQLLKLGEVIDLTKIGRSQLYAKIARGEFPSPVKVGERSIRFRSDEVEEWIDSRPRSGLCHEELTAARQETK